MCPRRVNVSDWAERETHFQQLLQEKKIITRLRSDFLVDGDNDELLVLSRTSWKTRFRGCLIHHGSDHVSSCQLRWRHLCQLEVHEDELRHVELSDQHWKKRMAVNILLRIVLPTLGSATRSTLARKNQSCSVCVSFHLVG